MGYFLACYQMACKHYHNDAKRNVEILSTNEIENTVTLLDIFWNISDWTSTVIGAVYDL